MTSARAVSCKTETGGRLNGRRSREKAIAGRNGDNEKFWFLYSISCLLGVFLFICFKMGEK